MIKWLPKIWPFVHYRTLFGGERKPPSGGQYVENTKGGELWLEMLKRCPDCHHKPLRLAEGPRGGISINVFCIDCGQGFNITPMIGIAERIRKDTSYIQNNVTEGA